MYYNIKEKDLFGKQPQIDDCYAAVFIHAEKSCPFAKSWLK